MARARATRKPQPPETEAANPIPELTPDDETAARGSLVVIGSSAGGIQTLSAFVATLPADFPAPIVLAQHLDPHRPSNLDEILERRSTLPVVMVSDNTPLEQGKVYVVPANRHVVINDGHASLESDYGLEGGSVGPRPSVDLLLTSAAHTYCDRLVAVILTGSGMDGAAGAIEVKKEGGTVVIQNPHTALYSSMPLALPPTAVDHVVDLENLAELLTVLVNGLVVPPGQKEHDTAFQDVLALVSRNANIDFRQYKPTTILRRIGRRMAVLHCATLTDYFDYLSNNPSEVIELVKAFLIKVTEFFRDPDAFAYLGSSVLPRLIEMGRAQDNALRLWSAGCATGEEPYSLALMLADALGPELSQWNIKIFATDLDEDAVDYARRGLYPENVLNNLRKEYKQRFFERMDGGYRVTKVLRQMVIFGQQDLSRGVPFPRLDLVVCRNLLIYFQPDLQQQVLDKFAYSLYPTQGYLFLGQAETVRPSQVHFDLVNKKWKIYLCKRSPQPLAAQSNPINRAQPAQAHAAAGSPPKVGQRDHAATHADSISPDGEVATLRRFNDLALRLLPFGVVVVDHSYHILSVNIVARRLLSIRDGGVNQDFLHAARGVPYAQLRGAIDNAFRERSVVNLPEVELEEASGGNGRFVNLAVVPVDNENGPVEMVMITVQDATESVGTRRNLQSVEAEQKQLLQELQITNRRLSDMNKELQATNEELLAANEELMLAQEELQATNEELQVTNEELQVTNEELETNNEELQATNEELETTSEELIARTHELQDLSRMLSLERAQLSQMVELSPYYIMVLRGPHLVIEAYNPLFQSLLGGAGSVGRPIDEALQDTELARLRDKIWNCYKQDKSQAITKVLMHPRNGSGGGRRDLYFNYTIVPIHDDEDVRGVVVYAIDITEQLSRDIEQRRDRLRVLIEHADQVALGLFDAETSALLYASPRYLELLHFAHGYPQDTIIGRPWTELILGEDNQMARAAFRAVVSERKPRRIAEVRIELPGSEGATVWDYSLTPIPSDSDAEDDTPKVQYVAVSAIEITPQVQLREQLERLDKMKDLFLSSASHELRTPLVPLVGYSDLLARTVARHENDPGWDPRISEYTGKFRRQLKHISRLVNDLFDVARLESGKLVYDNKPLDLNNVVKDALEEAEMFSSRHQIRYGPPDGPVVVLGDEGRLVQVLVNLLSNAVKYAPESTDIHVRLERAQDEQLGPVAKIEVEDAGPGIPADDLQAIFTRFYQGTGGKRNATDGLGLGLFISQSIIKQHNGTIGAISTVGKGSTFTVQLPLAASED